MYNPLTKKIIDKNGQLIAVCRYYGTTKCQEIHNDETTKCIYCPMMAAMIEQLNAFEEVYLDKGE